jgi:hypothetical protein
VVPTDGRVSRALGALVVAALASPLPAQRLFRATDPVEVTFTTTLRQMVRMRDSLKLEPHPALMTYKDSGGKEVNIPVTLRARGHFRRQARNCDFPPIRWDARREVTQGTLFQGLTRLKITTNCRPGNADYEQYILSEYAVYRAYQVLSPLHFRTRLARITYRDSAKAMPDVVSWAFFTEDDGEMARQNRLSVFETTGALFDDVDDEQLRRSSLFAWAVGYTDFSIAALHNVVLLRDSTTQKIFPVLYDFDWAGAVNARYAFPDARLKIRRVTDRLHRGPCRPLEQWKPMFAAFLAKRAVIDSIYDSVPGMNPARVKTAKEYWAETFKILADDRRAKYEIVEECQRQGM